MADLLVKLYGLPPERAVVGVDVRRALPPEKHAVGAWVGTMFGPRWASEGSVAFSGHPIGCHIAIARVVRPGPASPDPGEPHSNGVLIGFACWDATARGFFGPEGVADAWRRKGVGAALLLQCLHAMRAYGYGYAIIGGVGPKAFYEGVVPVLEIPGSSPGIYQGLLR
ncbi:MAG TPA: GNAT family N-acetyltransferase [Chloroflexi bacterium]|nr:GNAT family N-acetyltransferase [Chloroflexota bacterium]HAL27750.1 GNAT family N-acetyltransferase [Chloroflexota bacterium]